MSLTPTVPDQSGTKSFWSRPEGKFGAAVLVVIAGVAVLTGWAYVVPFVVAMLADTLHMVLLGGILAAIGFVACSKTIHSRVGLLFRMTMRYLTGMIINIDPIAILKDRLLQMRKRREEMGDQISNVNAQRVSLKSTIAKNAAEAQTSYGMALEAKRRAVAAGSDADLATRMQLQNSTKARHAARLEQANVGYSTLLTKLDGIYNFLSKLAGQIDFFIEDTTDEVKQQEIQYKVLNAGFAAFKKAMSIIKGNADESDLYDQTMERLADEASQKISFIEESQKVAQNFMDSADLQQGYVDSKAMADLDAFEQKMLTDGTMTNQVPSKTTTAAEPQYAVTSPRVESTSGWKL